MTKTEILGVKIDNLSLQEVLQKCGEFLDSEDQHFIATINPEFIVAAQKDKKFRDILNYADLAVADGIGLIHAAKFLGQSLARVTGVELSWWLCEVAEQKNSSIYLLGAGDTVAAQTAQYMKESFPALRLAGAESGGEIDDPTADDPELLERINDAAPQILLVALGQVKQEKWIFSHLDKLPSVKIAVGVGGTFDYLSGNVARAPEGIRRLGLEWLYRLILQPSRYKRIFNAVFLFSWLVLKAKFLGRLGKAKT